MKIKQFFALLLAGIMVFAAGCGTREDAPVSSTPSADSQTTTLNITSATEETTAATTTGSSLPSTTAVTTTITTTARTTTVPPTQPQKKTLQGTVLALTENTVTLLDKAGQVYRLPRKNSSLTAESVPLAVGVALTVTYTGTLTGTSGQQPVSVLALTAKGADGDPIETWLNSLTLEEKVGQMFLVRCPEKNADSVQNQYQFGGYVLFGQDFRNRTPAQAKAAICRYQDVSKAPMFIAVDEEGGTVNRVSCYKAYRSQPFSSPQTLFQEGGMELIQKDTIEKCRLLRSLGINLNLAPVCDVSTNPADYIYARTFGQGATQTADYIKTIVSTMTAQGMGSVLKHFPGYGSNVDTHTGIAVDKRPLEQFRQEDLLPFASGIAAGAPVVMISHNIVCAMDAERPASLSSAVHALLRQELNFDGLIVTDALDMGAIKQYTDGQEAAVAAVIAGNDLLCCTDYASQFPAVVRAVRSGKISEERINQSVRRILHYKCKLGLLAV